MKADPIPEDPGAYVITDMVEKPKPGCEFTDLAILGRVLLTPEIFDILDKTPPGAGGEIQLTDAMAEYARHYGMTGRAFEGERFDLGSKLGFMAANLYAGIRHPEIGKEFSDFVREFARGL